tara:strand:+ start:7944 stop:8957 length:1014 start_codon:yes stop_codon:yes gene_type:complete
MNLTILGGGELFVNVFIDAIKNIKIKEIHLLISRRHSCELYSKGKTALEKINELINSNSDKEIKLNILDSFEFEVFENSVKGTDLQLSFSAPWIYKEKHINICSNLIQLHCTTLPEFRGGGNTSWRILSGINYSSVVLFKVNPGIDTGDIVFYKKFFFPKECYKPNDCESYTNQIAFESITKFVNSFIEEGSVPEGRVQQNEFSSYFPRLNTNIHGYINWSWDAYEITKFITAFDDPYPGAITRLTNYNEKLHLKGATLLEEYANFHPFQQGIIFRKDEDGIYICSKKGSLKISEVLNENNEVINNEMILGERFFNDYQDLHNALSTRIKYNSKGIK